MKLLLSLVSSLVICSLAGAQQVEPSRTPTRFAIPMDRMHYDAPGDGKLWARGETYKASFAADGATYIPFLGSDAPRNMPVRFTLQAASLGGVPLQLNDAATWMQEGDSVTLERGDVDVRYHLGLEAMEQTFVIDDLPRSGELLIRVAVDSELELREAPEGFRFEGERGGVDYGTATVYDRDGRSLQVESRLEQGGIAIRVPETFLRTASLPIVVDPFITSYTIYGGNVNTWSGSMSFDASYQRFMQTYTYGWSVGDSDVYSVTIDEDGNINWAEGAWIDISSADWTDPSIANNNGANNFVVACRVRVQSAGSQVWSRTRQLPGTGMGTPRKLNQNTNHCTVPSIGGESNIGGTTYYCVVWGESVGSNMYDIQFRLLSSTGSVASTTIFLDTTLNSIDANVKVSRSTGRAEGVDRCWNIVWSTQDGTGGKDIYGAQVSANGILVTPSFPVDTTPTYHTNPTVSSPLSSANGGAPDFLVVYQAIISGQSDIHARLFKRDDYLASFDLTALEADVLGAQHVGHSQRFPIVATDGNQFIVAYSEGTTTNSDQDVFVSSFAHMGAQLFLTETQERISSGIGNHQYVGMASAADAGLTSSRSVGLSWLRVTGGQSPEFDTLGGIYRSPAGYANIGTTSCDGNSNTTGFSATFRAFGVDHPAFNHVFLDVDNLPPFQWGQFLMSQSTTSLPISNGVLCLGGPQIRLPNTVMNSWTTGSVGTQLDLTDLPPAANVLLGQSWYFQYWYRDGGGASNFSNALRIDF